MISSSELIWVMVDQNWHIGVNCVEITKHVVCDLNMLIYICM